MRCCVKKFPFPAGSGRLSQSGKRREVAGGLSTSVSDRMAGRSGQEGWVGVEDYEPLQTESSGQKFRQPLADRSDADRLQALSL